MRKTPRLRSVVQPCALIAHLRTLDWTYRSDVQACALSAHPCTLDHGRDRFQPPTRFIP
jgi:hypothetical protein